MSRDDEPAAECSRSYCVFERDRVLPRPASRQAVMNDANLSPPRRATPLGIKIGFGVLAIALLWWFA
jgi:hypothetical protein